MSYTQVIISVCLTLETKILEHFCFVSWGMICMYVYQQKKCTKRKTRVVMIQY